MEGGGMTAPGRGWTAGDEGERNGGWEGVAIVYAQPHRRVISNGRTVVLGVSRQEGYRVAASPSVVVVCEM